MYDVAIIGGGIAGFATAMRLQYKGYKTIIFEAHGQLGGCAGFFTKKGFAFDVGATTLVDFARGGIGGDFFDFIDLPLLKGEYIDYIAWLPDKKVTLYKDRNKWKKERLDKLGNTPNHIAFWALMDKVTDVFWTASRNGIKLPLQSVGDVWQAAKLIGFRNIYLAKYINKTMLEVLQQFHLADDKPLKGLLSMLIEDTVHSSIEKAPFLNAALGTTIRGAGLMRATGGMKGFWDYVLPHYLESGGTIKRGHKVLNLNKINEQWHIKTSKKDFIAHKIISSLPINLTQKIAPTHIQQKLLPYITKNDGLQGSAIVVFLGVPESEVFNQELTHHQILKSYDLPLGNGNNMFISISAKDDIKSAPKGYRSVMISTHTRLQDWQNLSQSAYKTKKAAIGKTLVKYAQEIYPNLGQNPVIYKVGTPLTYEKYTHRKNGAVGGYQQTVHNANFKAVPQNIGEKDFFIVGDTTWPGLGTVAGLIGSEIVTRYF